MLASNPIWHAYQGSDLFGKAIFLALFSLSIITWTLFLKKWLLQREVIQKGHHFAAFFHKKMNNILAIESGPAHHPFARLFQAARSSTYELLQKNRSLTASKTDPSLSVGDVDLIKTYLEGLVFAETTRLEKYLFVLSTIVSLAPFLGLLGTVWGILLTFAELQSGGEGGNMHATVMGGLAMALGTTVLGLLVAIPALIAYNYLKASVYTFSVEMEKFAHHLLARITLQYRK